MQLPVRLSHRQIRILPHQKIAVGRSPKAEFVHKRRGQSFHAEFLDPSVKKLLNQCTLCGGVGLKPNAGGDDYDAIRDEKTVKLNVKHDKFMRKLSVGRLRRTYAPLPLDKFGRFEVCSQLAESDKAKRPNQAVAG